MSISEGIDLSRHGSRRIIVASGHDEASSIIAQGQAMLPSYAKSWRTPSGETVREGGRYEVESRLVLKATRISGGVETLRFGYRDFLVSERLDV